MNVSKILRRIWPASLALPVAAFLLLTQTPQAQTIQNTYTPPAPAIISKAETTERGVEIRWLASQAGSEPLNGYVVERMSDGRSFEFVARVEKVFLSYLDTEGQKGDSYRVIAEDARGADGRSRPSNIATAQPTQPGAIAVQTQTPSKVLGAATPSNTPDEIANHLNHAITEAFAAVNSALDNHDPNQAKDKLADLHNYQQEVLSRWHEFDNLSKETLKQTCAENVLHFTASIYAMPEAARANAILAEAGCRAIQEAP